MAAQTQLDALRQLYGQPRGEYQGARPLELAEVRVPLRLVHMRRSGNAVLLAVADEHQVVTTITVEAPDDTRLQAFSAADRNRVHGALLTISREGWPSDGNP